MSVVSPPTSNSFDILDVEIIIGDDDGIDATQTSFEITSGSAATRAVSFSCVYCGKRLSADVAKCARCENRL